jgi:hypothetical protein
MTVTTDVLEPATPPPSILPRDVADAYLGLAGADPIDPATLGALLADEQRVDEVVTAAACVVSAVLHARGLPADQRWRFLLDPDGVREVLGAYRNDRIGSLGLRLMWRVAAAGLTGGEPTGDADRVLDAWLAGEDLRDWHTLVTDAGFELEDAPDDVLDELTDGMHRPRPPRNRLARVR